MKKKAVKKQSQFVNAVYTALN